MNNIDLPGAGHTNNLDARRVFQSHGTCQVRCAVPSGIAAKCDDDRIEILAHRATVLSWTPLLCILKSRMDINFTQNENWQSYIDADIKSLFSIDLEI